MSGERKRGALTPELGCGFAVGVLLAWAVLSLVFSRIFG